MDRIVRMWNPYVPDKPTGMLRGHAAPIFYLFIADEENRIFSISTDKCIKVRIVSNLYFCKWKFRMCLDFECVCVCVCVCLHKPTITAALLSCPFKGLHVYDLLSPI